LDCHNARQLGRRETLFPCRRRGLRTQKSFWHHRSQRHKWSWPHMSDHL
jgi:hypothetical protein